MDFWRIFFMKKWIKKEEMGNRKHGRRGELANIMKGCLLLMLYVSMLTDVYHVLGPLPHSLNSSSWWEHELQDRWVFQILINCVWLGFFLSFGALLACKIVVASSIIPRYKQCRHLWEKFVVSLHFLWLEGKCNLGES